MAIINKDKLDKLSEIILRHVNWFIWRLLGKDYSSVDSSKVDVPEPVADQLPVSIIHLSFVLGGQEAQLTESEQKTYGWGDLSQAAKKPLTGIEELQIKAAESSVYSAYRKLGDDIVSGLYDKLSEATGSAVSEAQVRGIIADKVKFGVLTNRAYYDVAKDLVGALKDQKRNWSRVATTEMHKANQAGVADAIINKKDIYKDSDGIDSTVAIVPGRGACEDCLRLYVGKDGNPKIFKMSELLANAGTNYIRPWRKNAKPVIGPLHPNSIAGYAIVEGNIIAETRMSYSGQIREIVTAKGHTLPVTPNHSVATLRGFIPAHQIQEGDYLLSYDGGVKYNNTSMVSGSFLPKDGQYRPTKIEEVFRTLDLMNSFITVRRFGHEFHGDAAYGDSDIDIVYADSKLRDRFKPTIFDQVEGLLLETSKFSSVSVEHMGVGDSFFVGEAVGSTQTITSNLGKMGSSSFQPSNTCCIGSTSYLDSTIMEFLSQSITRDASFCRNIQQRLPGLVTQDQVIKIRDMDFSGHVYDLQTVSGVIVAEGLIISNCFCRLRYIPKGWGYNKEGRVTIIDPEKAFPK